MCVCVCVWGGGGGGGELIAAYVSEYTLAMIASPSRGRGRKGMGKSISFSLPECRQRQCSLVPRPEANTNEIAAVS